MKLLFVVNGFYPYSCTTTNIINKLLFDGGLKDSFQEICVLCGKDHYKDSDFEEYCGISVYRTWSWTELPISDLNEIKKNHIFIYLFGIFQKLFYHLEKGFIDKQASKSYFEALKRMHAEKYDAIISVSGRYYQTDAVEKFCRETNSRFVFYQVDPCGSNKCSRSGTLKERIALEQRIYKTATNIITTDLILRDVKKYINNQYLNKVTALEFPLVSNYEVINRKENPKVVCLFSGSIYGGIRNPDYAIRLFKKLISENIVELHFVGVDSEELKEYPYVICHGRLSIQEANDFLRGADILVNIGNSVLNQVPSKIFDYISTGKPIVNVCKNRDCPTLTYLKKYPTAINLFEEEDLFATQMVKLEYFIHTCKNRVIHYNDIETLFYECTPSYCGKRITELLKNYATMT